MGIDQFLLVQWLAPIASEAPELIVAVMFAWRGRGDDGIGALLSSKVNQWTLLIGSLPIAYFLGGGAGVGLPLDARQVEEVALTAAQTVLGLAILINLDFGRWEAIALAVRHRHLPPTVSALVRTPGDEDSTITTATTRPARHHPRER